MKLLFFSDLHGDMKALDALRKKAKDVDLVICAGDISTMEHNLPEIIEKLSNFPKQVLLVHGNHEDEDNLKELVSSYGNIVFLHKAVHHAGDYVFMGYGGDGFSSNDPDFVKVANSFFKPETAGKKRMILVTHGPPYNTGIDKLGKDPRGNKSYREFIDDIKPHLVVSGHLHENAGKSYKIGRTLLLNPGKTGAVVNI